MSDLSTRTVGLVLTLALLLGAGGCAARGNPADRQRAGSAQVSFLPEAPATEPLDDTSRSADAATTAAATPQETPRSTPRARTRATPRAAATPRTKSSAGVSGHAPLGRSPAPTRAGRTPAAFLPFGACAAGDPAAGAGEYRQIPCAESSAVAKVIGRYPPGVTQGSCPAGTDFALDLRSAPAGGGAEQPSGIACLRSLHSPHPGDPGGGAGVGIVPGDCLYRAGGTSVLETACSGTGSPAPDYKVVSLVAEERDCAANTAAYIAVHNPGAAPRIACASAFRPR